MSKRGVDLSIDKLINPDRDLIEQLKAFIEERTDEELRDSYKITAIRTMEEDKRWIVEQGSGWTPVRAVNGKFHALTGEEIWGKRTK